LREELLELALEGLREDPCPVLLADERRHHRLRLLEGDMRRKRWDFGVGEMPFSPRNSAKRA
jgi:hypothetical protein